MQGKLAVSWKLEDLCFTSLVKKGFCLSLLDHSLHVICILEASILLGPCISTPFDFTES